jgi:hypothetical protein
MIIQIKRIVAIWVACALLLCGVCAGAEGQSVKARAEESDGWRLANDMSVDSALLHDLLMYLCPSSLERQAVQKIGVLINAVEPSLTVASDGVQLDIDLNGGHALSIGGKRTDDSIIIASTLFPSYAISIPTGQIMEIASEVKPMTARPKISAKDVPEAVPSEAAPDGAEPASSATGESDAQADDALPVRQMSQYINITAPESVVYQENGVSFDVKRTYSLDCDGIASVWNTFVDWVFENKGVASLLEIAKKADLAISADQVKAALPVEALPRFDATYYSNSATADRLITATAVSGDGTKVYGNARIQIAADDVTATVDVPDLPLKADFELHWKDDFMARLDVRGNQPLVYATLSTQEDALSGHIDAPVIKSDLRLMLTQSDEGPKGQLEINILGSYLGADFNIQPFDANGDGLRFTASLYYTDKKKPLFREELSLQPHGALTLDYSDAKKTLTPITSLFNVSNGYLVGFALDIIFNGIGGLLDATTKVLSDLNQAAAEHAETTAPAA